MNNAAGKIHCSRSRPRHISNLLPKYTRENSPKSYPRAFRKIERNSRWQSRKWLVHANFVPSSLRGGQWMRSKLPGITILQRLINPNFESIIVRRQKQFLRDKNGENRAACQSFLRFDSANEKKLRTLKIGSFWVKSWLIFETYV